MLYCSSLRTLYDNSENAPYVTYILHSHEFVFFPVIYHILLLSISYERDPYNSQSNVLRKSCAVRRSKRSLSPPRPLASSGAYSIRTRLSNHRAGYLLYFIVIGRKNRAQGVGGDGILHMSRPIFTDCHQHLDRLSSNRCL